MTSPDRPLLESLRELGQLRLLRWLAAAALFLATAVNYFTERPCMLDPDLWWHLKVGDWIVAQRAFPHSGVLTYTALDRPWAAYSWGYEVLISRLYAAFGLEGIGWFGLLLTTSIVAALLWATTRLSGKFWSSVLLTGLSGAGFVLILMPRPYLASITLFTIVLALLLEARRCRRVEVLYPLPLLFVLWANLHIQFLYGLFPVFLLVTVELAGRLLDGRLPALANVEMQRLPLLRVLAVATASLAATCIGPYGWELYGVVMQYTRSRFAYQVILELQAVNFRHWQNFVMIGLAFAAMAALGWRRKLDLYRLLLLPIAVLVGLRTVRDSWFCCVVAALCLASCLRPENDTEEVEVKTAFARSDWAMTVVLSLVLALLVGRNMGFDRNGLDHTAAGFFPARAAAFLQQNQLPGPLYNTLDWGGYLAFAVPELPVAIDGRNDLFGDGLDEAFYRTQMGLRAPEDDVYLQAAHVVLLQQDCPLTALLLQNPSYRLVYRDGMAVIFVKR